MIMIMIIIIVIVTITITIIIISIIGIINIMFIVVESSSLVLAICTNTIFLKPWGIWPLS